MNYLSIDLGDKVCWLAYSNQSIIFMLDQIERHKLINHIKKIIKEKNISTIVVWLPYDLYQNNTKQLDKTKKFIKKLNTIFKDIKIDSIDERYTTFESLNILKEISSKKDFIKKNKDSMSAYLILESYLSKKN